jgi:hypothetical protein
MDRFASGFAVGFVIAAGLMLAFAYDASNLWKSAVIQRGAGLYCPVDGHFAFTDECDKN